jgi:pimeloyl-ACP methyl ester carboxylesterase
VKASASAAGKRSVDGLLLGVRSAIPRASFRTVEVDGLRIFYREAGPAAGPVVLLLHGFPLSSHMFRELIPRLATRYRVIAPDLPVFGFTRVPEERDYKYSFEALARTVEAVVNALGLKHYALYVFDYGAPVGYRVAVAHPERVTAIVSQNGNAYEEGLGDWWAPISALLVDAKRREPRGGPAKHFDL